MRTWGSDNTVDNRWVCVLMEGVSVNVGFVRTCETWERGSDHTVDNRWVGRCVNGGDVGMCAC